MFGSLRKKLEEATAQLNPFDGGKTASTVRATRQQQVAPAQTVRKSVQPTAPQTTQQRINNSFGGGVSGFVKKSLDRLDLDGGDTEADRIRRFATTGLKESYDQEQKRKTTEAQNSTAKRSTDMQVGGNFYGGIASTANPGSSAKLVGAGIQSTPGKQFIKGKSYGLVGLANNLVNKITGVDVIDTAGQKLQQAGGSVEKTVENKIQQSRLGNKKTDNKVVAGLSRGAGQLVGQAGMATVSGGSSLPAAAMGVQTTSGEYDKARAAGKSNDQALAIGVGQGLVSAGLEKVGLDRLGKIGGGKLVRGGLNAISEGGTEGLQQFGQNLIANRTYDPKQGLMDNVLESAGFGTILGGGVGTVTGGFKKPPTTSLVKPKQSYSPQDIEVIKDISESQVNPQNYTPREQAILQERAIDIQKRTGTDLVTGSRSDINQRAGQAIESFQGSQAPIRQLKTLPIATNKQPTTSLISRAKSMLTPLNEGGYIQLGAPEPKKLSQDIKDQFSKQGSFGRDAMDRLEANKISKGDLERAGVIFDPKQVKKIAQTLPEFKDNPVMTYRKGDYRYMSDNGRYRSTPDVAESGTFEFKHKDGVMRLNPEALFGKDMARKLAQTAKDGEQVDFRDTMKASGNRLFTYEQSLEKAGIKPIQKNVSKAAQITQQPDQSTDSSIQENSKQQPQQKEPVSSKLSSPLPVSEKTNASVSLQPTVQRTNESSKGLVLSETKPINGQKKQIVRTGQGQVEQRTVGDQIGDALGMTQEQREPTFNAVAAAKNSTSAKRLVAALNTNEDISQAAAQAQQDGKEINFFAKKDANGRSVGVERFNPKYHKIEAGFVTDQDGNVLGNHIKVDATGVQVNVGGDLVNMESVLGNPNSWRNKYETSSTMERNIYKNAPDKATADKTYKFTVAHKIQSEANFKTELSQQRQSLKERTKATMAAKPRRTSDTEYKSDMFDFIENNASYTDMIGKYGEQTAKVMSDYKTSTRTMYNDLLKRVNEKFQQFGIDPVPQRKDYLTHINELMGKQSFVGELAGQLQNSITGEGSERTRGAVPGDIAGRTENFKPTKKWNKFFQERKGGEFTKDPFKAVDAYLEPTLHNIHMTESGVRTRAVEAAFRTAAQLKSMDTSHVTKELDDSIAKFKVQGNNDKLIRGFQEYANAITGKTQKLDRDFIDMSDTSATALRGWQKLQGVAGRATILGNANSVLMQPLNQVATLSQVGPRNYLKGLAASISGDKSIEKSPFITARQAKVDSNFKSKGQRVMDAGGVPLEMVEMASVKATWNAQHQSVLKDGYKGQEAIIETDRRTERTVAGRGIADKPELYRSTLANGFLQYTLEVNAQNKMFLRDLSPKQKATFMVATLGVNSVLGAVTGNTPLPDFLKAAFESIKDFADGEEDDSIIKNVGQTAQRFAGEAASMNPLASGVANLLPKSTRQTVFGKDSDLGRYEGTSAPVQVVKNVVDAGSKLAQGKYKDARNSALKDTPFGNQIQKTWRGAEAIADGQTEGSIWQSAKALAFGPNAISTDTAKNDKSKFGANPSTSKSVVNASSVSGKTTNSLGEEGDVENILKAQFSTKEQKAWLALPAKDREAEAKQDPEKAKWLDQYEATKRVNKDAPDLPDGISDESKKVLEWHDKRTAQQKDKLAYSQNDYDYKLAKANYEKDTLDGTISRAEQINRQQTLKKAEIGAKFSKDTRESYNSLTKAELQALTASDENGKKIWDDAIAYGDELVKAGIIKKNKLRTATKGSGGNKGKGGKKGSGSKYDYTKNLFASGSGGSDSNTKTLRAILQKAMSGKS